jgi:hypothetical protein
MAKTQSKHQRPKRKAAGKARISQKAARQRQVTHIPLPEFKLDLAHDPEKYLHYHKRGARLHYIMFLIMLTIFNFLSFLALVPLMAIIKSSLLVLILGGIGLVFGMVYLYLIRDVEHLQPKHHIFAAFYIPIIAIVNIVVLYLVGRALQAGGGYEYPFLISASAIYVAMFLLPYAIASFFERLWPRKGNTI